MFFLLLEEGVRFSLEGFRGYSVQMISTKYFKAWLARLAETRKQSLGMVGFGLNDACIAIQDHVCRMRKMGNANYEIRKARSLLKILGC